MLKSDEIPDDDEPLEPVLEDVPVPEPGPGEAVIAIKAAALNFFDILMIQGKYQIKPPFPFSPGAEVADPFTGTHLDISGPLSPLTGSFAVIAKRARAPVQSVFIDTDSPYLGKGWPIWRLPV